MVGGAICLACLAKHFDLGSSGNASGQVFENTSFQGYRVFGPDFLDAVALVKPKGCFGIAQSGHRQRLQIAGL